MHGHRNIKLEAYCISERNRQWQTSRLPSARFLVSNPCPSGDTALFLVPTIMAQIYSLGLPCYKRGYWRGEFSYTKGRSVCLLRIALNTKQNTTDGNVRSGRPLAFQPVSRRKPVQPPTSFSLCGVSKSSTEERSMSESQWNNKKKILALLLKPLAISGHAVAQLVEALRYKSEGSGFDSRWRHWNISLT